MQPEIGLVISNKYHLERLIGDGGMGSVYAAKHKVLGTTVALKFLHPSLTRRKGLVERFLQEAKVSAQISSPHVVSVSDVDRTADGLAYMVMEYVDGKTLQALYEELYEAGERLSYGDAFEYMLQILDGVSAAHKKGIVHRDLKPDNVMICDDADGDPLVKILDFGIAKLKASGEADRGLTRPGVVMGTPEYMPPEQAFSADKVDARADVFSLGVMFFEMLAGRRPVGGDNAHSIAAQYLKGDLPELSSLKPTIHAQLAKAVHRAMAPKPEQRFDTVADFKAAIAPFAPGGAPEPRVRAASASSRKKAVAKGSPIESSPGSGGSDGDVASVPRTLPPEETFVGSSPLDGEEEKGAPSSGGSDEEKPASSSDLQSPNSDETKPAEPQVADAASTEDDGVQNADDEASADGNSSDTDVDEEGDSKAKEDRENAAVAATEPDDGDAPRAGSTIVGDTFTPPVGEAIPRAVDAKPALRDVGHAGGIPQLPQAHAPQRRRKGLSMFANLFIALLITGGAVTGAYYWEQYQQQQEDGDTDSPIIELNRPTASPTIALPATTPPPLDPPPSAWPSATATSASTKPSSPHKTPPKPSARPTAPTKPSATSPPRTPTAPFTLPTGIPSVLPSTLPPGFPTSIPTIPSIPGFPPIPGLTPPPKPQANPPVTPPGQPATPKPGPSPAQPAGLPGFPSIPIP